MNPDKIRLDFPLLQKSKQLIYFDNACMSLRPKPVIQAITQYYEEFPACGGRSTHKLSRRVDEEVYKARKTASKFFNAKLEKEIIFLRNTTEGINLVAKSFPWNKGDVVLIGSKEHNSNLLPWQQVAQQKGLKLIRIPLDEEDCFDMDAYTRLLQKHKVRMVALGHTANLDGSSIPAKEIIALAHKQGAKVLLDAAQSAPHKVVDVRKLGVDFLACSAHKMMGPSGIGMLYASKEDLFNLKPYSVGGETVTDATYEGATFDDIPYRFEAGLQHYAGIIGTGAALNYLNKIGLSAIAKHEARLNALLTEQVLSHNVFKILGPQDASKRSGIVSFYSDKIHHHDIASLMDASRNIALRSGRHCVHSFFNAKKLEGSVRASVYAYNTEEEVAVFGEELGKIVKMHK